MSYISRRLAPGERIIRNGEYHWVQKAWPWVALVVLGILLIGIVIWLAALFRMSTTKWAVTNRRVILKQGFFRARVDELTLNSIEGAHVDQSLLGRILGYGKLRLSGRGETDLQFPTMSHPNMFRSAIEQARIAAESTPVEVVPRAPSDGRRRHPTTRPRHNEGAPALH